MLNADEHSVCHKSTSEVVIPSRRGDSMTLGEHTHLIVDLARLGSGDLASGGGKAANMGELLRAGFPVPPGFVITTTAYDLAVRSNDLQRDIVNAASPGGSAFVRARFEQATIPVDVERVICDAYRRL